MKERPSARGVVGGETARLPVVEEQARIGKERRETGRVRVSTRERVTPRELNARLTRKHVEVESVRRDELLDERPEPRQEGDTFIFPVAEEVLVIETRWRLVEEVRVRPREDEREETIPIELSRREVLVEREGPRPQ